MTCHPLGSFVKLLILLLPLSSVVAEFASPNPEYHILPPLREQAKIQDVWTRERRANIPGLLQKYGIDAWLVGIFYNPVNALAQCWVNQFNHR